MVQWRLRPLGLVSFHGGGLEMRATTLMDMFDPHLIILEIKMLAFLDLIILAWPNIYFFDRYYGPNIDLIMVILDPPPIHVSTYAWPTSILPPCIGIVLGGHYTSNTPNK